MWPRLLLELPAVLRKASEIPLGWMNENFLESRRLVEVQLEKHMAAETERVFHDQELYKKLSAGARQPFQPKVFLSMTDVFPSRTASNSSGPQPPRHPQAPLGTVPAEEQESHHIPPPRPGGHACPTPTWARRWQLIVLSWKKLSSQISVDSVL